MKTSKLLHLAGGLLFIAITGITASVPRDNAWLLFGLFALLLGLFSLAVKYGQPRLMWWVTIGVLARVVLLFVMPHLSDDFYRFIWDGLCALHDIDPYCFTPAEVIQYYPGRFAGMDMLFGAMNSPDYYTVYPPVNQWFFQLATAIGSAQLFWSHVILKLVLLCAEMSSIWLMLAILKSHDRQYLVMLYALNPLVILELVGNIHFEALVITGLIITVYGLERMRRGSWRLALSWATVGIGMLIATSVKLTPVLTVPYLLRRVGLKSFSFICAIISVGFCLFLVPFTTCIMSGPRESLNMYFQTFEFNASIYYVVRWIGFLQEGYNNIAVIGPVLVKVTIGLLVLLFFFEHKTHSDNWPTTALGALTIYLLIASIVHPWYICPLVALCIFTPYRYPVVWSVLAFLSYYGYSEIGFAENLWLTGLEYVVVLGYLVYEVLKRHSSVVGEGG